jgi:hypothetical protein
MCRMPRLVIRDAQCRRSGDRTGTKIAPLSPRGRGGTFRRMRRTAERPREERGPG